jgi:hypothetical protein
MRSEYTLMQWLYNYCHSHVSFYRGNELSWLNPCLGTGPIRNTIETLHTKNDPNIWGLFLFELDRYVRVESLAGIPYRRMDSIKADKPVDIEPENALTNNNDFEIFYTYLIHNYEIKVAFKEGIYTLGEPLINFYINVSNLYIKWLHKTFRKSAHRAPSSAATIRNMVKRAVKNNRLYVESPITNSTRRQAENINGTELFMFKGNMVKLNIIDKKEETNVTTVNLLPKFYIDSILTKIFKQLNCEYGKADANKRKWYID